jgi:hypothetical protein
MPSNCTRLGLLLFVVVTGCSGKVTTTSGGHGGGPGGAPMDPGQLDDAGAPQPTYDATVPTEGADAMSSTTEDVSAPPATGDACAEPTFDASGAPDLGMACNPYWSASTKCSPGLRCCRAVGAPPYVEGDAGIETPGYTCESPSDARFDCIGPTENQPCDPNTASNDPLFCAWGLACQPALSCCRTSTDPTYACRNLAAPDDAGITFTCVL